MRYQSCWTMSIKKKHILISKLQNIHTFWYSFFTQRAAICTVSKIHVIGSRWHRAFVDSRVGPDPAMSRVPKSGQSWLNVFKPQARDMDRWSESDCAKVE